MVWDRADASSAWISGPSFTTPLHAYPFIDFSWLPERPTVNEIVQFTDKSVVFGGTTKVSWSWTFQDAIPSSSNQQNPSVKFTSTGPKIVTLKVTDSNGFACTGQKTISARFPLPDWREIPPIIWLKNSLASIGEILGKIF
ncbi:MAG: hypothetical protein DDT18_01923 [Actinobacteria bacterium]|nr:hypothetical protein [Actinomycetota bacterium]